MSDHSTTPGNLHPNHCTDFAEFLQILTVPGNVFEVRSIKCPEKPGGTFVSTASGYFNDVKIAASNIGYLESLCPPAIYLTMNQVKPALFARAINRINHKASSTTTDSDIVRRWWLFVDMDPKRPAGVSSTDCELLEASKVSDTIRQAMRASMWPEPLQGMSGNGRYLLWRIDLPNDEDSKELVKCVLNTMAIQFDTDGAEVDCSTFNAARICKVLGTVARKGDELVGHEGIEDRPHRPSWFIKPDGPLEVVSVEQLKAFAASSKPRPLAVATVFSGKTLEPSDTLERAKKHLSEMAPSIEGEKRSDKLLLAAKAMVQGFGLSQETAVQLLQTDYNLNCIPLWTEREIQHKVADADKGNGNRGYLLRTEQMDGPWPEPISFDCPRLPHFPVDALPEPLNAWVLATAEAYQVPADLPSLLVLAVCSGTVARRLEIVAGPSWREPVNLYVACLLEPANRKSAVFSAALAPLRELENKLIEDAKPRVGSTDSARRIKEAKLKELEKTASKGGDKCQQAFHQAAALAAELAALPVAILPKLLVDDATPEAVEMTLAAQGGRLVCAGAEGGIFSVMGGRYSAGGANLDCFLKGHAGDDLRVDRVGRGSILVNKCCLTLAYAIQPEVIRNMSENGQFRGYGLIARFMYAMPESLLGKRKINTAPVSACLTDRYSALVRRLAAIEPDGDQPRLLSISDEASKRFCDWQREVESWLGENGRLHDLEDWGGKLAGLTARLAAILHIVETDSVEPWSEPISLAVIESAIRIARWSVSHAEAVIGLMTKTGSGLSDAAYVLRWIRESGRREFSRRNVQNHARSRFDREPEKLDHALELLVERGWIRPIAAAERPGPGRKASPLYAVNPAVARGPAAPTHSTANADIVVEPRVRERELE